MKKSMTPSLYFAAAILMMGTMILSACSKDNDTTAATVSEEEAAEAVTQAVSATSGGGIAVETSDAARMATTYSTSCGLTKDTLITRSSGAAAVITYEASAQWHWALTCTPTARFDFSFASALSYDAPRMSSNDSLSSAMVITGLEPGTANYLFNMSATRKGSQVSKILRKNTFTSTIIFTGTDIAVSKTTYIIQSGTAAVTISGAGTSGRSFQYAGTVVFTGNKTATLTLGSGVTYNIQW